MILILDDHPLVRQGLATIIENHAPNRKLVQVGTVQEAKELASANEVYMAFIDIRLAKENGLQFLQWLKELKANVKTFVITSSVRRKDFLDAKALDVDAYVLKDAFVDEVVYAFQVVSQGKKFYSSTMVQLLDQVTEDERLFSQLTTRECEVLGMLSRGMSNAGISKALFVSEGTIKKHISSILTKLDLTNRVQAVIFASKNASAINMMLESNYIEDNRKGVNVP